MGVDVDSPIDAIAQGVVHTEYQGYYHRSHHRR